MQGGVTKRCMHICNAGDQKYHAALRQWISGFSNLASFTNGPASATGPASHCTVTPQLCQDTAGCGSGCSSDRHVTSTALYYVHMKAQLRPALPLPSGCPCCVMSHHAQCPPPPAITSPPLSPLAGNLLHSFTLCIFLTTTPVASSHAHLAFQAPQPAHISLRGAYTATSTTPLLNC